MFQRYSIGSESSSRRMPGELISGNPSIAMTRMCFSPDLRFDAGPRNLRKREARSDSKGISGSANG